MSHSSCPDPDELACFIDGVLDEPQRLAIIDHLATCEHCTAVVAEVARDQPPNRSTAEVIDLSLLRWWHRRGTWLIAAAAVLLPIVVAVYLSLPDESGRAVGLPALPEELAASLPGTAWPTWYDDQQALGFAGSGRSIAFLIGVRLADLQAAVLGPDREQLISGLQALLALLEVTATDEAVRDELQQWLVSLRRNNEWQVPDDWQATVSAALTNLDEQMIAIGAWAETGRLAAIVCVRGYFTSTRFSHDLEHVQQTELIDDTTARQQIETIARFSEADSLDCQALERAFEQLILVL